MYFYLYVCCNKVWQGRAGVSCANHNFVYSLCRVYKVLYGVAGAAFAFGIFIRVASVVYVARTAPFSARCGFLQICVGIAQREGREREREVATPHLPLLILYGYLCCTFHLSLCCFSGTNEAIQKAAPCPGRGESCHVAATWPYIVFHQLLHILPSLSCFYLLFITKDITIII